jgi:hypothetical protein
MLRSDLTQTVSVIEGGRSSIHACPVEVVSGQSGFQVQARLPRVPPLEQDLPRCRVDADAGRVDRRLAALAQYWEGVKLV